MQQALSAALQLLTDIEDRMCNALGLGPTDSLPEDPERLKSVPQPLLNNLEVREGCKAVLFSFKGQRLPVHCWPLL